MTMNYKDYKKTKECLSDLNAILSDNIQFWETQLAKGIYGEEKTKEVSQMVRLKKIKQSEIEGLIDRHFRLTDADIEITV